MLVHSLQYLALVAEPSCRLCFCYNTLRPSSASASGLLQCLGTCTPSFFLVGCLICRSLRQKPETASMSRLRIFARSAALDSRASSTDHSEPRNKRKANHKRGLGRWARKARHTDSRGLPRPSSRASKEEPALAAVQRGWCSSAPPARRCPAPGRCGRLGTASPELHTAIQLLVQVPS